MTKCSYSRETISIGYPSAWQTISSRNVPPLHKRESFFCGKRGSWPPEYSINLSFSFVSLCSYHIHQPKYRINHQLKTARRYPWFDPLFKNTQIVFLRHSHSERDGIIPICSLCDLERELFHSTIKRARAHRSKRSDYKRKINHKNHFYVSLNMTIQ